jgi:hypothetical protein
MNPENELKLQAYLDRELAARDAQAVEAQVKDDADARMIAAELQWTKAALQGNDLERTVPETREFYWSKIERTIQAGQAATQPRARRHGVRFNWLSRFWPQLGGAWAVSLLLVLATIRFGWLAGPSWIETDHASNDMGAMVFRSDAERMTMVWLYDRDSEENQDESDSDGVN